MHQGGRCKGPEAAEHMVKVLGKDSGKTGLAGAVSETPSCLSLRLHHWGSRK